MFAFSVGKVAVNVLGQEGGRAGEGRVRVALSQGEVEADGPLQ